MTKLRSQEPPLDPELAEFSGERPLPAADPTFREDLRAGLWQLLKGLLARFRGGA